MRASPYATQLALLLFR
ncbi:hypothetical protein CGLO_15201 [Colletotrichum gloeosporioides Cg-14]|uniref:Uncharacterized protein n=1 Tax=Colletotrichum gloeosporioides (strain Cg-14) TaxID=1237896 RepID=T0LC52_COLGC|nr:hypothetical protein CGLO_15201 [Colletotrichum gloeosporioides Cg-14]